jgi:hypothetical protein
MTSFILRRRTERALHLSLMESPVRLLPVTQKLLISTEKSTYEEVTFSHTWIALPGYFLRHKITSIIRKEAHRRK